MSNSAKFVHTTWINGKYQVNWLRSIDYQTKTQVVSNCQWTGMWKDRPKITKKIYGEKTDKNSVVYKRWSTHATRFRKIENGFTEIKSRLRNPDGNLEITPISDLQQLICPYTYEQIFNIDVRQHWAEEDYEHSDMGIRNKMAIEDGRQPKPESYTLDRSVYEVGNDSNHWNKPLIDHLKTLFNREQIFSLHGYRQERSSLTSLIGQTVTFFHITKFANNKQYCTFDEVFHNRTIAFWLFNDCLVYSYQEGIDSW